MPFNIYKLFIEGNPLTTMAVDVESEFDRPCCTACLAFEQSCAVLLDEVRIGGRTLTALDEGINVVDNRLLNSLRRDAPLEPCTRSVS